ncbi:unnamed protein product [Sordaria macrospora k-hell]|uniref:WGS project CABT00000000 data, contig 2.16 n=2 Tax=Sordaria macrospora TaxID=5147 RepID=F7W006_SORMK|nr:uncharacterized protein SMAC_03812 [Sordaria macrospora k-hell]CCC11105.1 unnamed protein product [Sordaria macrospora k-hell]
MAASMPGGPSLASSSTPSSGPWFDSPSDPNHLHPETLFSLRTCYGILDPPKEIYVKNVRFCGIDQGESSREFLLEVGYHVRRTKPSHGCADADVVVTVGEDGDIWLPTDTPHVFSVLIHPETYMPLIRVSESLPIGSVVVIHHGHADGLPRVRQFPPPRYQVNSRGPGELRALTPGEDYSVTVHTRYREARVAYTFDVVWGDAPIWKIMNKVKAAFVQHSQNLSHGPTFDSSDRPWFQSVQLCSSDHHRTGGEALVMMGTTPAPPLYEWIAIKRFTKSNAWGNRKAAQNEIKKLRLIRHPHIVEYLGDELDRFRNDVFLGWMDGRDIEGMSFDITSPWSPTDLWSSLLFQMLLALDYLAARNIVHEDVKPGNILHKRLGSGYVHFRLADFSNSGRSWIRQDTFFRPLFRPPEWTNIVKERKGGTQPSADIWALAMTMVCVAERPHGSTVAHVVWDKVEKGLVSEAVETLRQQSIEGTHKLVLLRPMLCINPDHRATAYDMIIALQIAMGTVQNMAALWAASFRVTPEMVESPQTDDPATDVEPDNAPVFQEEDPQVDDSATDVGTEVDGAALEQEDPQVDGSATDVGTEVDDAALEKEGLRYDSAVEVGVGVLGLIPQPDHSVPRTGMGW